MADIPSVAACTPAAAVPSWCFWASRWRLLLEWGLAVASGLLLSAAFPPVEQGILAWVALVPLLCLPPPPTPARRLLAGYVFGLAHFLPSLWWLNTIGFAAGILLALPCALFPMAWYLFVCGWGRYARDAAARPYRVLWDLPEALQCGLVLLLAAGWVALEWVRGWLFTGFSWNQLGVSQWQQLNLLNLTTVTGVYGVSFLVVAVNVALAASWGRTGRAWLRAGRRGISWPLGVVVLLFVPVMLFGLTQPRLGAPAERLRVLAVQGCLPQCRVWTEAQLTEALAVYTALSRTAVQAGLKPDLIVWPETAIPAPLRYDEAYRAAMDELLPAIRTPMLIGTIDLRLPPGLAPGQAGDDDILTFNSAFLIDAEGRVAEFYDKIHRVPFGEFTPLGRYLPWLVQWIGMGRDLTPGREFTVFNLPKGVRAGVMICYEDAFPYLARAFVLRGAELLVTLTNDAWYAESAGARQHLLHAVLRAAETRRPLLRAGNNSDTCLILPDGRISGLLLDPLTGNRFIRGSQVYDVPVWRDLPLTWYTRHGDVFAQLAALATVLGVAWLAGDTWRRRRRLHAAVTAEATEAERA
jgi:apolipoprotein N-acyltransferase